MKIRVKQYTGQFENVCAKKDLKNHRCARDYYYYVDFGCNAQKLEKMQQEKKINVAAPANERERPAKNDPTTKSILVRRGWRPISGLSTV